MVNLSEQRGVGFLGVVRLPALVAQVLQKIFDERLHGSKWVEGLPPPGQNAFRFAAANLQFSAPVANQNLPAPVRNLPTEIRVRAVKKKRPDTTPASQ